MRSRNTTCTSTTNPIFQAPSLPPLAPGAKLVTPGFFFLLLLPSKGGSAEPGATDGSSFPSAAEKKDRRGEGGVGATNHPSSFVGGKWKMYYYRSTEQDETISQLPAVSQFWEIVLRLGAEGRGSEAAFRTGTTAAWVISPRRRRRSAAVPPLNSALSPPIPDSSKIFPRTGGK